MEHQKMDLFDYMREQNMEKEAPLAIQLASDEPWKR